MAKGVCAGRTTAVGPVRREFLALSGWQHIHVEGNFFDWKHDILEVC